MYYIFFSSSRETIKNKWNYVFSILYQFNEYIATNDEYNLHIWVARDFYF